MPVRRSDERGVTELPWLDSRHSFSFGDYYDPQHMGYRALRVINEDRVAPGQGFGTHAHRDMEIITIVLAGALEHRDSLGHGSVLKHDWVQCMSAGSGIRHSEFNASPKEPVHFLQIWIEPRSRGDAPKYQDREFPKRLRANKLLRVAGGDTHRADNALRIEQDADVYVGSLAPNAAVEHALGGGIGGGRGAWVQVVSGMVECGGEALAEGDAIAVDGISAVRLAAGAAGCEVLVIDLG